MLKKSFLNLCLSFFVASLMAQSMSYSLESTLNKYNSDSKIGIVVLFNSKPDFVKIKLKMEQENIPVIQRPGYIKRMLLAHADSSQKEFLVGLNELARLFPGQLSAIQSYWISNVVLCNTSAGLIQTLIGLKGSFIIDLNDDSIQYPEVLVEKTSNEFPKGVQKGVQVIKAPFMWNMGYTGRGRKAMGCDTGVNFTHPALSSRFLGNHLPMSQCWFPYENPIPVDISNSTHGTHTMGTILGINNSIGDTIGIAYNAYWIATDPIVSNLAEVKPVGWILASFQWALDPDGNPDTGNDVPDVINNSWGLANSGNQSHCNSYLNQIFEACEAAGIGVVFSAGNEGPNVGTVGEPANISINEVNIFSVGSVSGASSNFPISAFSGRGPTNCVAEDSIPLWFKPEVVAPGEYVWSAQGFNSYGALSGTSMAAPHVAGAFLLLKEAFPQLTGTQILNALYQSATDLGNADEDNVYGKGIINLESAYNFLSQSYTPQIPANTGYDIAITGLSGFENVSFNNPVTLTARVKNCGIHMVDMISFSVSANGQFVNDYYWNGSIQPGQTIMVQLPAFNIFDGRNKIQVSASLMIDVAEDDWINNQFNTTMFKPATLNFPYFENFENADIALEGSMWFPDNPDSSYTWLCDTSGGFEQSAQSLMMPFYSYKPRLRQSDALFGPQIELPDTGQVWLKFRRAYQRRSGTIYKDSLKIHVFLQNGLHDNIVYAAGCTELATLPNESLSQRFIPSLPAHWAWDSINLSSFRGQKIALMLEAKNDNGNQLFIDDISVYPLASGTKVPEMAKPDIYVLIYPIPVKDRLFVEVGNAKPRHIQISGITGQIILIKKIDVINITEIDVSDMQSGIYFVKIYTSEGMLVKRFVKK